MQDTTLMGANVRTVDDGHLTTATLGNYHADSDSFDGWVKHAKQVQFTVAGGETLKGFGSNSPWGALPEEFIQAGLREWDSTQADRTQNGKLFVRVGGGLEAEFQFEQYMDKREKLQLPDQFTQPAETLEPGPDATGQNTTAGAPPPDPPAEGGGLRQRRKRNRLG